MSRIIIIGALCVSLPSIAETTFLETAFDTRSDNLNEGKAADLDGDNDIDFVAISSSGDSVFYSQNNGSNQFTEFVVDSSSDNPREVLIDDIDKDGGLDIVVAYSGSDEVIWYRNSGVDEALNSVFERITLDNLAINVMDIVLYDINNDGFNDVVASEQGNGQIVWHRNEGNGTFTKQILATANTPGKIALGDLNNDGLIDIVGEFFFEGEQTISWLQNLGDGDFQQNVLINFPATDIAIFDIDSDGFSDVFVTTIRSDLFHRIEIQPNGTFTNTRVLGGVRDPSSIDFGDFDADGDIDILVGATASRDLLIAENIGDGNFSKLPVADSLYSKIVQDVVFSDIDFDGDLDMFALTRSTADAGEFALFQTILDLDDDGVENHLDLDDDGDGVNDEDDAFPFDDSESLDTDNDGLGNNADTDDDNDGIPDEVEQEAGLNSLDADDAVLDADNDGLSNLDEFLGGTSITNRDSDGDGVTDFFDSNPTSKEIGLATVYDGNRNSVEDLLFTLERRAIAIDAANGGTATSSTFPGWLSVESTDAISDINGNGVWEMLIFGITSAGDAYWRAVDGQFSNVIAEYVYTEEQPVVSHSQVVVLPDLIGDPSLEIAILAKLKSGASALVVFEPEAEEVHRFINLPGFLTPTFIDVNANWFFEEQPVIHVHGTTTTGNKVIFTYTIEDGELDSVYQYPSFFDVRFTTMGSDVNKNDTNDLVAVGKTSSGANAWLVIDLLDKTVEQTGSYPGWFEPSNFTLVDDNFVSASGDGLNDLITIGTTPAGFPVWLRNDLLTSTLQRAVALPGFLEVNELRTTPDYTGNGEPEVLVLGQTPAGLQVVSRYDSRTGGNLTLLSIPAQ